MASFPGLSNKDLSAYISHIIHKMLDLKRTQTTELRISEEEVELAFKFFTAGTKDPDRLCKDEVCTKYMKIYPESSLKELGKTFGASKGKDDISLAALKKLVAGKQVPGVKYEDVLAVRTKKFSIHFLNPLTD